MIETSSPKEDSSAVRPAPHFALAVEPVLLILVACAAIGDGWRIIATKADIPGGVEAGGWIAALGILLLVGSCFHLALDFFREHAAEPLGDIGLIKSPAIALAMLLAYIALIGPLGYVLSTALFMTVYIRSFGRYRMLTVAAVAIPFAVGSGWLWAVLHMMLPQGPLPWP